MKSFKPNVFVVALLTAIVSAFVDLEKESEKIKRTKCREVRQINYPGGYTFCTGGMGSEHKSGRGNTTRKKEVCPYKHSESI